MKHKAQDSLDTFKKCMRNITNYTFNGKEKCDFKTKDTENMQNLIDSQLTEEEINAIQVSMSYYNLRNHDKPIGDIDVGYGGDLFLKLEKQKGMWYGND